MKPVKKWVAWLWVIVIMMSVAALPDSPSSAWAAANRFGYTGTPLQQLKNGAVAGFRDETNQVLAWLGVPYAKPPVGDLRWRAPRDSQNWRGVLETKQFQNKSLQNTGKAVVGSEDCLYLNIWRPDSKQQNLPVLVFLHGGGNTTGSADSFTGDVLAHKTQSVVISIDYRLGLLGWFRCPALKTGDPLDDSGNYGLLDAIKSLQWVKQNIRSFGGDPNNVTLAGQSAGGRDVLAILISPLSKGLFHKAIPLSGGQTLSEAVRGEQYAADVLAKLVIKDGKAANEAEAVRWIAAQSAQELVVYLKEKDAKAITALCTNPPIKMGPFPHLFKDGYVIPKAGFHVLAQGKYRRVPIMLGSCANEFAVWALIDPSMGVNITDLNKLQEESKIKLLAAANHYGSKLYAGFNSDSVAEQVAGVKGQPPVFIYRFAWGLDHGTVKSPLNTLLAATHGADMDFVVGKFTSVINTFYPGQYYTDANQPGREALSNAMMGYLKNFLYTGNPNGGSLVKWLPWRKDGQAKVLVLDADANDARIGMSGEYLQKAAIIEELDRNLPAEEGRFLTDQLFADRFFWEF